MVCDFKGEKKLLAGPLQSVSARVRVGRGRRRGQGDCGGQVHRVVHGQDQAGAPDGHLVFSRGKVMVQPFVEQSAPGAGGRGAVTADGAGAAGIRADGDVRVHGADAGVVQDEVGVIVVELTFVLGRRTNDGNKQTAKE